MLRQKLEVAALVEHPIQDKLLARKHAALKVPSQLIGKVGRYRAFKNCVAVLFHLADLARQALPFRAVAKIRILNRPAAEMIVQRAKQKAGLPFKRLATDA